MRAARIFVGISCGLAIVLTVAPVEASKYGGGWSTISAGGSRCDRQWDSSCEGDRPDGDRGDDSRPYDSGDSYDPRSHRGRGDWDGDRCGGSRRHRHR